MLVSIVLEEYMNDYELCNKADDYITNNETFNKIIQELFNQYTDYKITKTPNSFGYPYFLSKISKEGKYLYQM